MTISLLTLPVRSKRDVLVARKRARQIAGLLRYSYREQQWISARVFEIARGMRAKPRRMLLEFEVDGGHFRVHPAQQARPLPRTLRHPNYRMFSEPETQGFEKLFRRLFLEPAGKEFLDLPLPGKPRVDDLYDLPFVIQQLHRLTPLNTFDEIRQHNLEMLDVLRELSVAPGENDTPAPAKEGPLAA